MAEPTRFHLIRHGAVAEEWQGRIYGDLDVPLSAQGQREMEVMARQLAGCSLDAVVSSGLSRTEFGAALLRETRGLSRVDETDLREIGRGGWRGLSFEELEQQDPGAMAAWRADPRARPPDGESLEDVRARVLPALDRLADRFKGLEVAIVTHSWVTRITVGEALGIGPVGAHRLDLRTGRIVTVDWPGRRGGHEPTLAGFSSPHPPARAVRWHRGPRPG